METVREGEEGIERYERRGKEGERRVDSEGERERETGRQTEIWREGGTEWWIRVIEREEGRDMGDREEGKSKGWREREGEGRGT